MHKTLTTLLDRLDGPAIAQTDIIRWGCPVPSFGDLSKSRVATLGLNPSNREFVDDHGEELDGAFRRFHTLRSLHLKSWADADARDLESIIETCQAYFLGNPYDTWFRRLDYVVSGANASFYDISRSACHLDLIPYATMHKWTELTSRQKFSLLDLAADTLALLLRDSPVRILILNGQSVVARFEEIARLSLEQKEMPEWTLPRELGRAVNGFAYHGTVAELSGIPLGRDLLVLGYNHNLQSSFGVTKGVAQGIRDWISQEIGKISE